MKIYDEYMSAAQKKLMKWAIPIVKNIFPLTKSIDEGFGFDNAIRFTIYENENKLQEFCDKLNVFPTINAYVWYEDISGAVPAGIVIEPIPFWNLDFEPKTFHFIKCMACNNKIPFDTKLISKLYPDINIEYGIQNSEDGLGIEGTYANHKIDFTIEAIDYTNCDGNPDEEGFEYYLIPNLWVYSGNWDGHYICGLASSSTLAVGKMLSAIYKDAEKYEDEVAKALKANFFKFHSYGFCH